MPVSLVRMDDGLLPPLFRLACWVFGQSTKARFFQPPETCMLSSAVVGRPPFFLAKSSLGGTERRRTCEGFVVGGGVDELHLPMSCGSRVHHGHDCGVTFLSVCLFGKAAARLEIGDVFCRHGARFNEKICFRYPLRIRCRLPVGIFLVTCRRCCGLRQARCVLWTECREVGRTAVAGDGARRQKQRRGRRQGLCRQFPDERATGEDRATEQRWSWLSS
jgi:hypothetical protein